MTYPDYRALCAELLAALENAIRVIYHEDGTKHINTADAVIAKADAALARPEPVAPTDEELLALRSWSSHGPTFDSDLVAFARAAYNLGRQHGTTPTPIPIAERPWERDGWCDADGRCWWGRASMEFMNHDWVLATNEDIGEFCDNCPPDVILPFHALPLPEVKS
jgi:hypothetical protein